MEPVDVRVVSTASEELSNLAVEFGGTSNFQAPQIGTAAPVQILTRRPTRYKAVIMIDTLSNGGAVPGSGSISVESAGYADHGYAEDPAMGESATMLRGGYRRWSRDHQRDRSG